MVQRSPLLLAGILALGSGCAETLPAETIPGQVMVPTGSVLRGDRASTMVILLLATIAGVLTIFLYERVLEKQKWLTRAILVLLIVAVPVAIGVVSPAGGYRYTLPLVYVASFGGLLAMRRWGVLAEVPCSWSLRSVGWWSLGLALQLMPLLVIANATDIKVIEMGNYAALGATIATFSGFFGTALVVLGRWGK